MKRKADEKLLKAEEKKRRAEAKKQQVEAKRQEKKRLKEIKRLEDEAKRQEKKRLKAIDDEANRQEKKRLKEIKRQEKKRLKEIDDEAKRQENMRPKAIENEMKRLITRILNEAKSKFHPPSTSMTEISDETGPFDRLRESLDSGKWGDDLVGAFSGIRPDQIECVSKLVNSIDSKGLCSREVSERVIDCTMQLVPNSAMRPIALAVAFGKTDDFDYGTKTKDPRYKAVTRMLSAARENDTILRGSSNPVPIGPEETLARVTVVFESLGFTRDESRDKAAAAANAASSGGGVPLTSIGDYDEEEIIDDDSVEELSLC